MSDRAQHSSLQDKQKLMRMVLDKVVVRTGELMCTTTCRFLDLPPRGKKKCQPISICVTHVMTRVRSLLMVR